ncbi:MAG: hypothetical protein ACJAS4_001833 [Bacteriovoracaceae bacterium]|jgi:hypothetical protein
MSSEHELEIYRQFRTSQDKYGYFILAAVGAAIGFALTQTNGKALSYSQIPLGISLISWCLSFYFGCNHLNYVSSNMFANLELLKVEKGRHPKAGNHPQVIKAASDGIRDAMETNSKWSSRFARWQFQSFTFGGISYVVWHVLEMWMRVK